MVAYWNNYVHPVLLLVVVGSHRNSANAQDAVPRPIYEYLDWESLSVAWEATAAGVGAGNGVYIIPNNRIVVVSRDGTIRAYNRLSGQQIWGYAPDAMFESFSGAFYSGGEPCRTFATRFQVVALNPTNGQPLGFSTGRIDGVAVGTPVTSADGQYIYTNYNTVDGTKGFFSVYDIDSPADPIYTYTNDIGRSFGALGYFHKPARGYYKGGEDNQNDIFIWSLNNKASESTVGTGQMYAFQMPNGDKPMEVVLLGTDRSFQTALPPVLTNEGANMYWAVSRNEQRCWVGGANLNRFAFEQDAYQSVAFPRGTPVSASALAPPSFSSSTTVPVIYGPTAGGQIYRMTYQFQEGRAGSQGVPTVDTNGVVSSRILVGKDDSVIYYATPAPDGKLYQLDAESLAKLWSFDLGGIGIEGDIAQSDDGAYVYVADVAGKISAFLVASVEQPPKSSAPTSVPNFSFPTTAPLTLRPTQAPVSPYPTMAPASSRPTLAPISSDPTKAPASSNPTQASISADPTKAPASSNRTQAPFSPDPTMTPDLSPSPTLSTVSILAPGSPGLSIWHIVGATVGIVLTILVLIAGGVVFFLKKKKRGTGVRYVKAKPSPLPDFRDDIRNVGQHVGNPVATLHSQNFSSFPPLPSPIPVPGPDFKHQVRCVNQIKEIQAVATNGHQNFKNYPAPLPVAEAVQIMDDGNVVSAYARESGEYR